MKPSAGLTSCTCLPVPIPSFSFKRRKFKFKHAKNKIKITTTTNPAVTMSAANVVPFAVPVGHLEPSESWPVYSLPALPDLRSPRTMKAVLRVDKARKERKNSSSSSSGADDGCAGAVGIGYAVMGQKMIEEAVDDILAAKGEKLTAEDSEKIKQSFLTDNQAHYLALCYRMEQHIHHYGAWATLSTRDMADVFRGYIGALAAENETGAKGVFRWLHRLLEGVVSQEIEWRVWKGGLEKVVDRRERPGNVGRKGKGKENERLDDYVDV